MKINPFIISGYSPKLFCNRKKETARIVQALENGRNVTLFSLRKIGKTGLIHNVFEIMKKKRGKEGFVYIDVSPAEDIKGFLKIFSLAIVKHLESKPVSILREAAVMLKSIRPKISFDPKTGEASISMSFESTAEAEDSLIDIMNYLKKRSAAQRIFIAFDEFQQITNFPEKNLEALLRSHIQFMNNANFIFSGSERNMMISIFTDSKRPFYQSTEIMHLEKIDFDEYKKFIASIFSENDMAIENEAIEYILNITRIHTYYVQYVCNKLFALYNKKITVIDIDTIINDIVLENEDLYFGFRKLLSEQQWKLLIAIGKEPGIQHITSKNFLRKYDLGSQSTVSASIKILINKELLYEDDRKYFVYDVFFSKWLERYNY